MVIQPILTALVARTMWADFAGIRAGTRTTVNAVMRRLASILLTNLLVWIGVLLGAVFFVVPGVILSVVLWLSNPACVVEGIDTPSALRRSVELTRGQRWRLLAVALVMIAIVLAIQCVCYGLLAAVGFDQLRVHGPVAELVRSLEGGIMMLLWAVGTGSTYVELLRITGGRLSAEATAAVFA
jgi:hypothetical protein